MITKRDFIDTFLEHAYGIDMTSETTVRELKCNQVGCEKPATLLYVWPGKEQAGICSECAKLALSASRVLGFYLEMTPVSGLRPDVS